MKIDPYKHKERYLAWKPTVEHGISGISKENSDLVLAYLNDMEKGLNVATGSVKGARSYIRLNSLREKIISFSRKFEELYGLQKVTDITEDQLIGFFADMKSGLIKRQDGKTFTSVDTASRIFKAFWHWHQKVNKKRGIEISDITTDLDTRQEKPVWVYLTEDEVKKLAESAKFEYKVLIYFLYDTGIRSPTELINVRVSDLFNDYKELNIRNEVSKTFGRRIKLMLCSDLVKQYVQFKKLLPGDQLFPIHSNAVNRYLKSLALKLFGDGKSPAGANYSELTMYDFRHCSCCYWLPRYKSESALKYRFGWKKSDKIHYYSELLGMKDTISEDDMLLDITKTDIEKRLEKSDRDKEILADRVKVLEKETAELKKISLQIIQACPIFKN